MPIPQETAEKLTGHWKVGLFDAPSQAPGQCGYGCCCTPCAAYQQRSELLDITGEPYVCCAGLCPCGPLGEPQDRKLLFLEVCCCPGWALNGNRYMVQTRFNKENTPCDDCILWTTCLFALFTDVARCCCEDDIPAEVGMLSDCLVLSVNGCMHAQQHIEIKEIKKTGYSAPPPQLLHALPPQQQQMVQWGTAPGGHSPQLFGASQPGGVVKPPAPYGQQQQQPVQAAVLGPAKPPTPYAQQPPVQAFGMPMSAVQPPVQQPPVQQQQPSVQVQCGGCGKVFGAPAGGVVAACPFCEARNQVGPSQPAHERFRPGPGAVAMGAGAGVIGGFVAADAAMGLASLF